MQENYCEDASLNWEALNYFMRKENMKLNDVRKKTCAKCPYKLGIVETLINPCPECKQNGHDLYERFRKLPWQEKSMRTEIHREI